MAGAVFRHGVQHGLLRERPDARPARAPSCCRVARHRAAVTDPDEAGRSCSRAIEAYQGTPVVRAALALGADGLPATGTNSARAEWSEFDLDGATVDDPRGAHEGSTQGEAERRSAHSSRWRRKLSRSCVELQPADRQGPLCLPQPRSTAEQADVGERDADRACGAWGSPRRRSRAMGSGRPPARSSPERLDVPAELIEAQLAHAVSDSLGRANNRTRFLEQRRQMMPTWANYLDKLRGDADRPRRARIVRSLQERAQLREHSHCRGLLGSGLSSTRSR